MSVHPPTDGQSVAAPRQSARRAWQDGRVIDLRSDTVTRPTEAMRAAMAAAEVGDDVWGDDPTVVELEQEVAGLLGHEAGLFVSSGTQGNLCATLAHCARGEAVISGDHAHTFVYEAGGAAVLGGVQQLPVRVDEQGCLDLSHVAEQIKPDNEHFAPARLLCLENTHDGKALPLAHHTDVIALARERGLSLHLDGARLWNAAVALDVEPAAVAAGFDTVSVCLSKGLGAPVGSVLVGHGELIAQARRWRKMLGGGLRQVGIVAAGGLHAVRHHRARLADDHANAARLADGLSVIDGVDVAGHATNMVFVNFTADPAPVVAAADNAGVLLAINGSTSRMVTHGDLSTADIDTVVKLVADALA